MAMDLPTIGRRLADELRSPNLVAVGLYYAYYPAPSKLTSGPSALVFSGPYTITTIGHGEEIWEGQHRVQIMVPALGSQAAEINAIEPIITPLYDHFAPGSSAYTLRVSGESGHVHRCFPDSFDPSQTIEYGGPNATYTAITVNFGIKFHRTTGG